MSSLKVCTLNVRGLNDPNKRARVFASLRSFDIIFVQETNCSSLADARYWSKQWGSSPSFFSYASSTVKGVGILLSRRLDFSVSYHHVDPESRFLVAHVSCQLANQKRSFLLLNVYAPYEERARKRFFSELDGVDLQLHLLPPEHTPIIAGDFNCIFDPSLDKVGGNPAEGTAGADVLENLCNSLGAVDLFRELYDTKVEFTWRQSNGAVATRLDRIYVDLDLVPLSTCTITPSVFSDHCLVSATFDLSSSPKGKSYWRLDPKFLKEDLYFHHVYSALVQRWLRVKSSLSLRRSWNLLKFVARQASQEFARSVEVVTRVSLQVAQADAAEARARFILDPSPDNRALLVSTEEVLLDLVSKRQQEASIRSQARWHLEGESATSFFCSLEKSRSLDCTIDRLVRPDGTVAESTDEILQHATHYYAQLYSPDCEVEDEALQSILEGLPSLNAAESLLLSSPLTVEEFKEAARTSAKGRCPGLDGLPVEFYVLFWDLVGHSMHQVFSHCISNSLSFPSSCLKSVLVLLPKGGDKEYLTNWRPLSMMCADVKIVSKALYSRILPLTQRLVHRDQTGFIPGRNITDNILSAQCTLDFLDHQKLPGALLLLDQAKAFDRVLWEYRDAVLRRFGFPKYVLDVISCLHQDIQACVSINGHLGPAFPVLRGTRQGDPLSPLLYALVDEPFAVFLRRSLLRGLPTPRPLRLLQYADDKAIGLHSPEDVVPLKRCLRVYCCASGAKINDNKSELILSSTSFEDRLTWQQAVGAVKLIIPGQLTRYLGALVGVGRDLLLVWQKVLSKFLATLSRWANRPLSLSGKVTVLRTLATSQLWYTAAVTVLPRSLSSTIEKAIRQFLWGRDRGRITFAATLLPRHSGGLSVPKVGVFTLALHTKFARQFLLSSPNDGDLPVWLSVAFRFLNPRPIRLQWQRRHFVRLPLPCLSVLKSGLESLTCLGMLFHSYGAHHHHYNVSVFLNAESKEKKLVALEQVMVSQVSRTLSSLSAYRLDLASLRQHWSLLCSSQDRLPTDRTVWRWVWHRGRDRRASDLLYLLLHNRVITNVVSCHFTPDGRRHCFACPQHVDETATHLFWHCHVARAVWSDAVDVLHRALRHRLPSLPEVFFFGCFSLPQRLHVYRFLLACVFGEYLRSIWLERCSASMEGTEYCALATIRLARSRCALQLRVLARAHNSTPTGEAAKTLSACFVV